MLFADLLRVLDPRVKNRHSDEDLRYWYRHTPQKFIEADQYLHFKIRAFSLISITEHTGVPVKVVNVINGQIIVIEYRGNNDWFEGLLSDGTVVAKQGEIPMWCTTGRMG